VVALPAASSSEVAVLDGAGVVDACCLLNLCASGRLREVLSLGAGRRIVASRAHAECGYLIGEPDASGVKAREPIDLQPVIQSGLLEVLAISTDSELQDFVEWAGSVDDGEAETVALALSNGARWIATDDSKARREIAARVPALRLLDTPLLMRHWARSTSATPEALREVLRAIESRARFWPAGDAEHGSWWHQNH
jgi:hypothetical protein